MTHNYKTSVHIEFVAYSEVPLYPALQLPELLHSKEEGLQKVLQVIMSVLGLAVGFSVLLVIALFEDTINVSVN